MIPKTKAHIPPEIEQEMTIEPPVKGFLGVLVIGVALVLVSHLAGFPRLTKPETEQPLAQQAEGMPDQLPDLSAGAKYQSRLSGGDFAMVDSREFAVVEELPDLVQDRAYHSRLSDTNFGHVKDRESVVMDEMPNQIPDHQALAEYQWRLGDSDFSQLRSRKSADVVELSNQIPDRGALAEYQSRLSDLGPPTTTAAQANKALIQRAYDEVLNNPNLVVTEACPLPINYGRCAILQEAELAVVDELFAPNFQHDQPGLPVFSSGSQAVRLHLSVYRLAFPDLHYTVDALVAEGDQVVARWQASGTHSGKFGLHTPTGEPMAWRGTTIWRIADGQIVEARTIQQGPTRQATRAEF